MVTIFTKETATKGLLGSLKRRQEEKKKKQQQDSAYVSLIDIVLFKYHTTTCIVLKGS